MCSIPCHILISIARISTQISARPLLRGVGGGAGAHLAKQIICEIIASWPRIVHNGDGEEQGRVVPDSDVVEPCRCMTFPA
jgi:hypothetical protein